MRVEKVRKEGGREEREREGETHMEKERRKSSQKAERMRQEERGGNREGDRKRQETDPARENWGDRKAESPSSPPRTPEQPHPGLEQGEPPIPPAGCSARTFVLAALSPPHPSRA